jgi:hypothetical protein
MPATTPAAFVGTGGRLRSERVTAFNRNPRPQSSESALLAGYATASMGLMLRGQLCFVYLMV